LLVPAPNICAVGSVVQPCRPIVTFGSSLFDDIIGWVLSRTAGVLAAYGQAWTCRCLESPAAIKVAYRDSQLHCCCQTAIAKLKLSLEAAATHTECRKRASWSHAVMTRHES
jgi:hypothetical protein